MPSLYANEAHLEPGRASRLVWEAWSGRHAFSKCQFRTCQEVRLSWLCLWLQFAMMAFEDMVKLSSPGTATEYLSNRVLVDLLESLARDNQPADIVRVLTVAQDDRRLLPEGATQPIGSAGGSFVTSWVPAALDSARSMRSIEGATHTLSSGRLCLLVILQQFSSMLEESCS